MLGSPRWRTASAHSAESYARRVASMYTQCEIAVQQTNELAIPFTNVCVVVNICLQLDATQTLHGECSRRGSRRS